MSVYRPQRHKHRLLKPVKGKYIPTNWIFLDTETTPVKGPGFEIHNFRLGWTCFQIRKPANIPDHYDWRYHSDEKALNRYLEFIPLKMGDCMLVGHNVFFDLQACGFFEYFTRWGWDLKFYYDKGLTYILKCQKKGVNLTVVSTTNWFDQSLERLGKTLGLEKGKVDFNTADNETLKKYCRRDVEIIVAAMDHYIAFLRDHDLGKFALTKASQAFSAYRHRFLVHRINLHGDIAAQSLERAAYFGGRCECFRLGKIPYGPFVSLDVNAMFPYVMKHHKYPYRLVYYGKGWGKKRILEALKTHAVIAEVDLDTPEAAFAIKMNKKTMFPTGRFRTALCSTGLQYALERGYVRKVHEMAVYKKADLFTAYVDYFYPLRVSYGTQGNDIMELLCKYFNNALYGKFGQYEYVNDITPEDTGRLYWREEAFNMVTCAQVVITHLMNRQIVSYPEGEGEQSFAGIAAHITENARFYLWEIINTVGRERVFYCDTDSVKIRARDLERVSAYLDPVKLGMLKVEDRSRELIINGPKNYRTEKRRKIKGIPRDAKETDPGIFTFMSFQRQTMHLREGIIRGVKVKEASRTLKMKYDKGIIGRFGRVTPFRL